MLIGVFTLGSLPYIINYLQLTIVIICCYINKTEVVWIWIEWIELNVDFSLGAYHKPYGRHCCFFFLALFDRVQWRVTEKQRERERKTCRRRATDRTSTQAGRCRPYSIWLPAHSNELNPYLTLLFVKLPSNPVYNPIKHLQNAPQQVQSMICFQHPCGRHHRTVPEIPCVHLRSQSWFATWGKSTILSMQF